MRGNIWTIEDILVSNPTITQEESMQLYMQLMHQTYKGEKDLWCYTSPIDTDVRHLCNKYINNHAYIIVGGEKYFSPIPTSVMMSVSEKHKGLIKGVSYANGAVVIVSIDDQEPMIQLFISKVTASAFGYPEPALPNVHTHDTDQNQPEQLDSQDTDSVND